MGGTKTPMRRMRTTTARERTTVDKKMEREDKMAERNDKKSDEWNKDSDEKDENHHSKRKDRKFCRDAKKMLKELTDYTNGDENHKRAKAEQWGGSMSGSAWDLFGFDSASSFAVSGAAMIAATAALSF